VLTYLIIKYKMYGHICYRPMGSNLSLDHTPFEG
jgi:hypothetical protein